MLNSIQPGSYITPHRHYSPPKSESIIVFQGVLAYMSSDDDGTPLQSDFALLDPRRGIYGVDIRPSIWQQSIRNSLRGGWGWSFPLSGMTLFVTMALLTAQHYHRKEAT